MPLEVQQGDLSETPDRNRQTVNRTWLDEEARRIREASEIGVPAAQIALANAYWNGRRESFNSAREDVLTRNPGGEKTLPAAIEVDDIRIRQQVVEQEQTPERTLTTAR